MRIVAHDDADGQCALAIYIFSLGTFKSSEISFPTSIFKPFGYFEEKTEVMIDMHPFKYPYENTLIDHHGDPITIRELTSKGYLNKDRLYYSSGCSTLALYHSDIKIPDEVLWLVAIGCSGDRVEHLIPKYIKKRFPFLFTRMSLLKSEEFVPMMPLSWIRSLVNTGRYIRDPMKTFKILLSHDIEDIVFVRSDDVLKIVEEKFKLEREYRKLMRKGLIKFIEIGSHIIYGEMVSKYKLQSRIASMIWSKNRKKTVILCNRVNDDLYEISIRGPLTRQIVTLINQIHGVDRDVSIATHRIAGGGYLKKKDLRRFFTILNVKYAQ